MAIDPLKEHSAFVMDRGGRRRVHELLDIDNIRWSRVRDDISTATVHVTIEEEESAQVEFLRTLVTATGRYELCIWRGGERVWEGPITLVTSKASGFEINARDVMHYAARTIVRAAYDNSGANVDYCTNRAELILTTELARWEALDPPINVVPYIENHHVSTDARTSRKTPPYYQYVYQDIDSMAAKSGMDYTVIGRAIHLWDTSKPAMGQTQTVTESDFQGQMYVSGYGMELACIAAVTDGQGNYGIAGEEDEFYGLWEILATAYDEDAEVQATQAELESQAERNLSGRKPTPLQVRVPDNSTVNLDGVLSITDLVPGIYVPMLAKINIVEIQQMQKLQTVTVTEDSQGETIAVTFYPASDPDEEPEGS